MFRNQNNEDRTDLFVYLFYKPESRGVPVFSIKRQKKDLSIRETIKLKQEYTGTAEFPGRNQNGCLLIGTPVLDKLNEMLTIRFIFVEYNTFHGVGLFRMKNLKLLLI